MHDLTLDCNANGQIGRASNYTNGATWCGILTCGNNIVISNVTVIHFGNQGNTLELFPLSIGQESSCMALDENTHIITLYSNITVQDSTLTDPATSNSTLAGVTVASMMPGWGSSDGNHGVIVNLTNAVFQNCSIENINTDTTINFPGWANGFAAQSVQNCYVNNCDTAIYYEVPNPIYYGQNGLFSNNVFTNVNFGFNLTYNGASGYPTAVGSITLVSNRIYTITNREPAGGSAWSGAVVIDTFPDVTDGTFYALPQIPSLTATYNTFVTGGGSNEWGFNLFNISNVVLVSNSIDNYSYGFNVSKNYLQRNPLSLLDVHHNGTSSQLVSIASANLAGTFSDIATQQKGDFYLGASPTLLWRNTSTGQNVCWPMDGTNTVNTCGPLVSNWLPPMPAGWTMAGTADFTGDCNNDILWTMPGTTNVLLWTMMGPSFISSNWLAPLPSSAYGIVGTGDFNGDGKLDLVMTNATGPTIRLMNGTKKLVDISLSQVPLVATAQIVGVGDFTGSGQADIVWRDYIHGTNFIWMMNGTTYSTTEQIDTEADTNWQIQGVGDFNGDGIADILWRHATTGSNRVWLTTGTLTNVILPQLTNLNWTIGGPK